MSLDHDAWRAGQLARHLDEQEQDEAFAEACEAEEVEIAIEIRADADRCLELIFDGNWTACMIAPLLAGDHAAFGRACSERLDKAIEDAAKAEAPGRVRDRPRGYED